MENWELIERRPFACVADAVAHYAAQGFKTWGIARTDQGGEYRQMRNGHDEVMIIKKGLLDVKASHIRLVA